MRTYIDTEAFGDELDKLLDARKRIKNCTTAVYSDEAKKRAEIEYATIMRVKTMLNDRRFRITI